MTISGSRIKVIGWCLVAGVCLAASVPPWGWWPLAFVGFALVDRLLAGRGAKSRFWRMMGVGVAWFLPATFWMLDMAGPAFV